MLLCMNRTHNFVFLCPSTVVEGRSYNLLPAMGENMKALPAQSEQLLILWSIRITSPLPRPSAPPLYSNINPAVPSRALKTLTCQRSRGGKKGGLPQARFLKVPLLYFFLSDANGAAP